MRDRNKARSNDFRQSSIPFRGGGGGVAAFTCTGPSRLSWSSPTDDSGVRTRTWRIARPGRGNLSRDGRKLRSFREAQLGVMSRFFVITPCNIKSVTVPVACAALKNLLF